MKYVIYTAVTDRGSIINMTCSPYIDYTYLYREYRVRELEVLTPGLDISHIDYIIRYMESSGSPFHKFLQRTGRRGNSYNIDLIKKCAKELSISGIKRSWIVDNYCELPDEADMEKVYELLKGRMIDYYSLQKIIKNGQFVLQSDIDDILQMLYLKGIIKILPTIEIQRAFKKSVCTGCGRELDNEYEAETCPVCGNTLDISLPLFAASYKGTDQGKLYIKYKENKHLSFVQKNASSDVCKFIKSSRRECLLWGIHGTLNFSILIPAVRDILIEGKRVLVTCKMDMIDYIGNKITEYLPETGICIYDNLSEQCCEKIILCDYNQLDEFNDAFDLIIICDDVSESIHDNFDVCINRAVKKEGKILYFSSNPDYSLYKKVLSGDTELIAIPIRDHMKPHPEPRILVYKFLSWKDYYIPSEVLDFINWSINEKIKTIILLPSQLELEDFKEKLTECLYTYVKKEDVDSCILLLTVLEMENINICESFNTIVFLADNDVYTDKVLIKAASLSGRVITRIPNEVLFVGSRESDEMYNTKMMLRFLNKCAWEMGYLK